VAQPRVAAFARLANGSVAPVRVIRGGKTRLARTSHEIAYDEVNDEIFVPNPFGQALLVFRGGADGNEAPIRVIQGPHTQLGSVGELALDTVNNEIVVKNEGAILFYPRDGNGDVRPLRIIRHGRRTQRGIAVDPVNNIVAIGGRNPDAILIFNRTDQGDVQPLRVISGPRSGIRDPRGFRLNAPRRELIVPVEVAEAQDSREPGLSFVGIWDYTANGDVPPKALLKGPSTMLIAPRGATLNTRANELYVIDKMQNAILTFVWSDLLRRISGSGTQGTN
jgi:hypothetical protein